MTLETIKYYLEKSFGHINKIQGADCIVLIGNTGCGKSTMLNSLVFGTESLVLNKGKIDQQDPQKYQIFAIGHEKHQSKTFLPQFQRELNTMDLWADYAGLDDTSGDLIDILNCFLMRQIFQISKSIRILVPLSK